MPPKDSPLRLWRKGKGLTLKNLSDLTGLSEGFLSRVEAGERNPSVDAKVIIAKSLDAEISDLFDPEWLCGAADAASPARPGRANGEAVSPGAVSPSSSIKERG